MGSAASAAQLKEERSKPIDASDVRSFGDAKAEIIRMRQRLVLPKTGVMEHRYGVSLQKQESNQNEVYLVGQGPDVLTFGRNHPYIRSAELRRYKRATTKETLVTITPSPQNSTIQSNHKAKNHKVLSSAPRLPHIPHAATSAAAHRPASAPVQPPLCPALRTQTSCACPAPLALCLVHIPCPPAHTRAPPALLLPAPGVSCSQPTLEPRTSWPCAHLHSSAPRCAAPTSPRIALAPPAHTHTHHGHAQAYAHYCHHHAPDESGLSGG